MSISIDLISVWMAGNRVPVGVKGRSRIQPGRVLGEIGTVTSWSAWSGGEATRRLPAESGLAARIIRFRPGWPQTANLNDAGEPAGEVLQHRSVGCRGGIACIDHCINLSGVLSLMAARRASYRLDAACAKIVGIDVW